MFKEIKIGKLKIEIETGEVALPSIKFDFMILASNTEEMLSFGFSVSLLGKELTVSVSWLKKQ